MPLVDEYIAKESWEKAEPLLDMLTRKAGNLSSVAACERESLGSCALIPSPLSRAASVDEICTRYESLVAGSARHPERE